MKTVGIIAEYDPFHKGHKLHIEKSRIKTGADFCVVLMGGDFTQRGGPALVDKYTRAEMALKNGADLILELPAVFALSPAEGFARGAVGILHRLSCVDFLSFGSECGRIEPFLSAAKTLSEENPALDMLLRKRLKEGVSYPKAFSEAAAAQGLPANVFSGPNNLLGIEYCRALLALSSDIRPVTVRREDNGYVNEEIDSESQYASARTIRRLIFENDARFRDYLCENTLALLDEAPKTFPDDYSSLLYYKLLSEADAGFEQYIDVNAELSHKIQNALKDYTTLSDFLLRLKSKNHTYARLSRALFHILLDMKKEEFAVDGLLTEKVKGVRVLGFRKDASELLSEIKKRASISLCVKPADLPANDPLLQRDVACALLYGQVNGSFKNELRRTPIIM